MANSFSGILKSKLFAVRASFSEVLLGHRHLSEGVFESQASLERCFQVTDNSLEVFLSHRRLSRGVFRSQHLSQRRFYATGISLRGVAKVGVGGSFFVLRDNEEVYWKHIKNKQKLLKPVSSYTESPDIIFTGLPKKIIPSQGP